MPNVSEPLRYRAWRFFKYSCIVIGAYLAFGLWIVVGIVLAILPAFLFWEKYIKISYSLGIDLEELGSGMIDVKLLPERMLPKLVEAEDLKRIYRTKIGTGVFIFKDESLELANSHSVGKMEYLRDVKILDEVLPELNMIALKLAQHEKYSGLELQALVRAGIDIVMIDLDPKSSRVERNKIVERVIGELGRFKEGRASIESGTAIPKQIDSSVEQSDER